jgi:hypothetical protein
MVYVDISYQILCFGSIIDFTTQIFAGLVKRMTLCERERGLPFLEVSIPLYQQSLLFLAGRLRLS